MPREADDGWAHPIRDLVLRAFHPDWSGIRLADVSVFSLILVRRTRNVASRAFDSFFTAMLHSMWFAEVAQLVEQPIRNPAISNPVL
jgi:hypothetical protein